VRQLSLARGRVELRTSNRQKTAHATKPLKRVKGEITGTLMTWPLQPRPCTMKVEE
jgi:hypothetical protein